MPCRRDLLSITIVAPTATIVAAAGSGTAIDVAGPCPQVLSNLVNSSSPTLGAVGPFLIQPAGAGGTVFPQLASNSVRSPSPTAPLPSK